MKIRPQFQTVIRTSLKTALTLMVLAACAPGANLPTATMPQQNGSQQAAAPQQASQTSAQASGSAALSATMTDDMTSLHEDEAIYSDSEALAQSEAGFGTKALGDRPLLQAQLRERVRPANLPAAGGRRVAPQQARQIQANAKARLKQNAQGSQLKAKMMTAGAVKVNADGTITLDPKAFMQAHKQQMQDRKQNFEQRLEKLKAGLELKKEIAKDKLQKLRHRDFIVKTSEKVTVTNPDGSITETIKIRFENTRKNIVRETVISRTSKDGKLLKVEFQLTEKTPAFERKLTRIATHNNDGSKNVLVDAKTTWRNGRVRERHEERVVNADGSGTGNGTITILQKDGSTKTYTFTVSLSAKGEMTSDASDTATQTEVIVAEEASGEASVIVAENGQETCTEVDLEAEAEADAIAEPAPEASPTASPEASPAASATPEASPAASATPEASPAASASPEASPEASPTPEASASAAIVAPVEIPAIL